MRSVLRSSEARWTVVVVVLALAGVVALWPRSPAPQAMSGPPAAGAPWQVNGSSAMPAPEGAAVTALRDAGGLRPCPAPGPAAQRPAGPLSGITVPCLGAPGAVDLAAALAGRPALLNVWASWCGPCREEIPVLDQYAGRVGAVAVVGIDVRDDAGAALRLLNQLGARYPSVVDTDAALWNALRVPFAIPTSCLLRADGSVRRVTPPLPFHNPDEVAQTLQQYLAAP